MKSQLTGGLVAAALLGAGLVCPGAAVAADPSGYPHDLGFAPSKLIATDDAVYAIGIDDDTAYVADVGAGTQVAIGPAFSVDAAVEPGGSGLKVVTFDDDYHYWHVATDDLQFEEDGEPQEGTSVEVLGTDSVGIYEVLSGETLDLDPWGVAPVSLAESATATAADARGAGEVRSWYVAGTQWNEDEISTATLWSYSEGSGTEGAPVALGAEGNPDEYTLDVVADQTGGAVYALSFRDNDDAPQSYGVTVVQEGPDTYFPLRYRAQQIALSPDGETLYLAQSDSVFALETDRLADYEDETDAPGVYLDASVTALAVDGDGDVFAATDDGAVNAFSTPAAPADLSAAPDTMSTTALFASWDEGLYSWEREEDPIRYVYSVRNPDDVVVASGTTSDQNLYLEDLQPGTTYTIQVAASNGLLASEPATDQVTTHGRYVSAPSAIAVQGSPTVGSQLSVASTGAWEAGTVVSYEWYGSNGEMGGAIGSGPTLPLTADHLGMSISVLAIGTKADAAGVTISSPATAAVSNPPTTTPPTTTPPVTSPPPAAATPGKLTAPKPKITGKAKVGKTLTAKAGSWTAGTKLTYAWSANGKRIKGADDSKLKLTKALKGKKISVAVTGTLAGYTKATKTSAQTGKVRR
ncbi:hypothetical protein GCM10023350_11750 [Nocardioides endophyticus]|uniref:Fibronectin type-III domain-containing protein n=1 Tax=Nocardioides endophyticus TaxID=1353775 RepID=A0ABP8YK92_9ACTN